VVVDPEDGVRLLARASWQPQREGRPTVVLVHGLGGCDRASYAISTGLLAWSRGWNVVRMNMRGAGDAEAVCARLYNAGLDTDLLAVVESAAAVSPQVAVVGYSLGGNLALLAAARRRDRLPPGLFAVAAVSPPLDLEACATALERPANRFYQWYYMRELRRSYGSRQRRLPDFYEAARERGLRTIREYDEAITAPYAGYASASEYYRLSSAGPHLVALDRPALILAAQDDPLVPPESVARWPLPSSGLVQREMPKAGGHVGFAGPTAAPGGFWAAERIVSFLAGALTRLPEPAATPAAAASTASPR
jgi:predicted alpha/beta-fold hydrolase